MVHHSQDLVSPLPQVKRAGRTDGPDGQIPSEKCAMTNQDPLIAMLHLRATPVDSHMKSQQKSSLGDRSALLYQAITSRGNSQLPSISCHRQTEMKETHDKHAGNELPHSTCGTTSTCSTSQGTYLDSCESLQSVRRAPVIRDLHPQRCCTSAQPFSPEGNPCQQCTH